MIQAGILQPIDYSGRVQQAFSHGQQQRREMDTDNALRALAANPNDPKGIAALTRHNPQLGFRLQEQNREREAARAKELSEVFGRAARAAKTPEQWDAIATWLSQNGVPGAANVVGKFSPEMRLGYMAQAGLEEDKDPAATSLQRNYEFFNQIDPSGKLGRQYVEGQAQPDPMLVTMGDGTIRAVARTVQAPSGPPAAAVDYLKANPNLAAQFDEKYGPGTAATILSNGGQTVAPSGGFSGN